MIGIEPGAAMPAQFHTAFPQVPIIQGDGQRPPLADASCNLITDAKSWHWTDTTRSVLEVLRVLRPGGALAIWWNTTAFDTPVSSTSASPTTGADSSRFSHVPTTMTPSASRACQRCGTRATNCDGAAWSAAAGTW